MCKRGLKKEVLRYRLPLIQVQNGTFSDFEVWGEVISYHPSGIPKANAFKK